MTDAHRTKEQCVICGKPADDNGVFQCRCAQRTSNELLTRYRAALERIANQSALDHDSPEEECYASREIAREALAGAADEPSCEHDFREFAINNAASPLDPPQMHKWVKCVKCGVHQ